MLQGLHEKIDSKLPFSSSKQQTKVLTHQTTGLTEGSATARLVKLQEILEIESWSSDQQMKELEKYSESIAAEQYDETNLYEQINSTSIQRFRDDQAASLWSQTRKTATGTPAKSFLVLNGINNSAIESIKVHCWLSPLAVGLIKQLKKDSHIVAFYAFSRPERTFIEEAIPILILNLLSIQYRNMDTNDAELIAEAHRFLAYKRKSECYDECCKSLTRLFILAIRVFSRDDDVYIVIDRADLCQDSQRNDLLRMLVQAINAAACSIHVVVVIEAQRRWRPNEIEIRRGLHKPAAFKQIDKLQGMLE